ncbi:MAG TPA: class I tRNA ligase family protein, partial [Candidatus Cloacimonadota bacterium]|nr:class I tRNA ligase family protein [Candidatus Cloacimonadota bacterium]
KCSSSKLHQDEDVLDTWFSSWLWPFSTMGWPDETADLQRFLPTQVLITAPEIIYLWVARMIMSTLHFKGVIPFDTVLLHGTVRDEIGRKMSKSLGNSPDPIDIIQNVGADALRFSMIFNTPKGADVIYSDAILEGGRNFANKIWNAYRFIMMNVSEIEGLPTKDDLQLELADRWIISRLHEVTAEARGHYENLRLNDAAQCIFQFLWDEYCSWYIELAKDRLKPEAEHSSRLTAKYVLLDVMQAAMRLLHPIMPFISEEIWQSIKEVFPMEDEALIIASFPISDPSLINPGIANEMAIAQESITAIRNLRKQINLSPGTMVKIVVRTAEADQTGLFREYSTYFQRLARVEKITCGTDVDKPKPAISAVVRNIEIFLPLSGLLDPAVERERLQKQIDKLSKELQGISGKLKNENFLNNAKTEVVDKEREKYAEVNTKLELIKQQLQDLS